MIGTRRQPAAVIPEPVDQPDDLAAVAEFPIPEPPAGDATAAEIAELEEQFQLAADAAASRAERDQAEYDTRMEAAREEAARLIAEREREYRARAESAAEARQLAESLAETPKLLRAAADYAAKAEAAEAAVQALEAERDGLVATEAEISGELADLAAEKRDLEPQAAAALGGTDRALITRLRNELDSIGAQEDTRRTQLAPVLARLEEIGDGEMSPIWPQKALAEARRVAHGARSTAASALNHALPDRPEAVAAARRAHEQLLDRAAADQRAAARQAAQYAQPRTFVAGRR